MKHKRMEKAPKRFNGSQRGWRDLHLKKELDTHKFKLSVLFVIILVFISFASSIAADYLERKFGIEVRIIPFGPFY